MKPWGQQETKFAGMMFVGSYSRSLPFVLIWQKHKMIALILSFGTKIMYWGREFCLR
jgi:hypothetical protein